jgi:hypothetical protein
VECTLTSGGQVKVTEHENDRPAPTKPSAGSEEGLDLSKETLEDLESPVDLVDEVRGQRVPPSEGEETCPCHPG